MRSLFQRWAAVLACCVLAAGCSIGGDTAATVAPLPTVTAAGLPARPTATAQPAAGNGSTATVAPPPASESPTVPTATEGAPATPPANGAPAGFVRTLKVAEPRLEGDDVKAVQERLLELGYAEAGAADGVFGPQTAAAVEQFQSINALQVDGVVGPQTWEALFGDNAQANYSPPETTGRIVFLKPDGVTLASVKPDGSDEQIFYMLQKGEDDEVTSVSIDPSGAFLAYSYGEQSNLTVVRLDGLVIGGYEGQGAPIWSPDGSLFLSRALPPSGDPKMVIYVTNNTDGEGPIGEFPGLAAAWFPDGKQIAYSDGSNIWIYSTDDGSASQLTEFQPGNPPAGGDDAWYVQDVEVSPDGSLIYFFGGQSINLGASGNGMQWWLIPSGGGSAGCSQKPTGCGEPIPFREPGGNGIGQFAYNPQGSLMAYSEGFHSSACVTVEGITAIEPGASRPEGSRGFAPAINDVPEDGGMVIRGLSWSPDGSLLAYAAQGYRCGETAIEYQSPTLYVWLPGDETGLPIAEGAFPVWLAD